MEKLNTFKQTLIRSVTSLSYYHDVFQAKFTFSLKFFYSYFFLFTALTTSIVFFKNLLPYQSYIQSIPSNLASVYPDELAIAIHNGEVSTNVDEPYFIPIETLSSLFPDKVTPEELLSTANVQNLLVIDTNAAVDDLPKLSTLALLTKTSFSFINKNGNIETTPLKNIESVEISKTTVTDLSNKLRPFIPYALPALGILTFVVSFLSFTSWNLIALLYFAFVIWLVGKGIGSNTTYKQSYQMGLHMIIVPTTIFTLLTTGGIPHPTFLFRDTLLITVWSILIHRSLKQNYSQKPAAAE